MIKTVKEYKAFSESLRSEIVSIGDEIRELKNPNKEMLRIATSLDMSFMTVSNYLKGLGQSNETALKIKEAYYNERFIP